MQVCFLATPFFESLSQHLQQSTANRKQQKGNKNNGEFGFGKVMHPACTLVRLFEIFENSKVVLARKPSCMGFRLELDTQGSCNTILVDFDASWALILVVSSGVLDLARGHIDFLFVVLVHNSERGTSGGTSPNFDFDKFPGANFQRTRRTSTAIFVWEDDVSLPIDFM